MRVFRALVYGCCVVACPSPVEGGRSPTGTGDGTSLWAKVAGAKVAEAAMGSVLVVFPAVVFDDHPRFGQGVELLAVEAFVAEPSVEAFDEAVLPRAAGLDVEGFHPVILEPLLDGPGDELGAVVAPQVFEHPVFPDGSVRASPRRRATSRPGRPAARGIRGCVRRGSSASAGRRPARSRRR
jgi:hypothetical protein